MNQVEADFILYGETRSFEQATKVVITDDTGFTPLIKVLLAKASNGTSSKKKVCHEDIPILPVWREGVDVVPNRK